MQHSRLLRVEPCRAMTLMPGSRLRWAADCRDRLPVKCWKHRALSEQTLLICKCEERGKGSDKVCWLPCQQQLTGSCSNVVLVGRREAGSFTAGHAQLFEENLLHCLATMPTAAWLDRQHSGPECHPPEGCPASDDASAAQCAPDFVADAPAAGLAQHCAPQLHTRPAGKTCISAGRSHMSVRQRSDSHSRASKTAATHGCKLGLHARLECCWTSVHMQSGSG